MESRRTALLRFATVPAWIGAAKGLPKALLEAGGRDSARQAIAAPTHEHSSAFLIKDTAPAKSFDEALPIGNGLLGASIFGGIDRERLALNEVTLWSGEPKDWNNSKAKSVLPEVRRLLFAGQFAEAEQSCHRMQGPYTQAYMPMGDLYLRFEHGAPTTAEIWKEAPGITARSGLAGKSYLRYSRELSLETAIVSVNYQLGGVEYKREFFASYPDKTIAIRLTANKPGRITFVARMDSLLRYATLSEGDTYIMKGKAPEHAEPNYEDVDVPIRYADAPTGPGMAFEACLRAINSGGKVWTDHDGIHVQSADEILLLLTAATSFNGYDKSPSREGRDPHALAKAALETAALKPYPELRERHLEDYQPLFNRVELNLGTTQTQNSDPTAKKEADTVDPERLTRTFHYARYRLIAASREGGQPVTLGGGMWDDSVRPPWSCNYTINENTQKQYSQIEAANLSECAEPYIDFMSGLASNGRKTATTNYGFQGWVAHHNTDLWRQSAPVGRYGQGDAAWANFMAGGIWLCQNLYNHFTFNGNKEFLRNRCYPILKGAAEFALDWLVEDKRGNLVTSPSTSPEARYLLPDGQSCGVSVATAADMSLIWELLKDTIEASRILGVDESFREKLVQAQSRMRPLKIGSKGQILEWYEEYPERDPHHRHASHLLGLCWGSRISRRETPQLFAAARRSFELRADGAALPDKLAMAARLEDGKLAYQVLSSGNIETGCALSIIEMLLQSHLGELHLLPALPAAWPEGYIKGVRARGGYTLDLVWSEGRLARTIIRAQFTSQCKVRAGARVTVSAGGEQVHVNEVGPNLIEFATVANREYTLTALS